MWHLIAACVLSLCSTDPLDKLEREARSFSAWEQSYDAPTGSDRAGEYGRLARVIAVVLGAEVREQAIGQVAGYTIRQERLIVIDSSLSTNAKLEVLAHEAGHLLQPPGVEGDDGQVFADAVSFLVTGRNSRTYARYLAGHKASLHVLKTYRREIKWAAKVLEGR